MLPGEFCSRNHAFNFSVSLPYVFLLMPSWDLRGSTVSGLYVAIVRFSAYLRQIRLIDQMSR